jgi:tetratricopeptide (TPR) repeat protein
MLITNVHDATPLSLTATLCFALLILMQPTPLGAQALSPEARRSFTEARAAQDAGNLDQAAKAYSATIQLAPSFAGAYSNLGLVYYVQGNFKESASVLSRGLQLDPRMVGATLYLGIDWLKLNRPERALPYLQHAANLDPGNKDAQSWLGTAYWESGQSWAGLTQFRETDRLFPNDPDIMFVLGEAYRKAAEHELEATVHQASGTAYVHQILGDIYLDEHSLAKAAGHYHRALEQDQDAANIHFELGEVALMGDRLKEAEDEYLQQLQRTPRNSAAKARLAEVALLHGDVTRGLHLLDEAITLSPLDTVYALRLPPSFATAGEIFSDEMLDELRVVLPEVEASPNSAARYLALAIIYARANRGPGQSDGLVAAWTHFQATIPRQQSALNLRDRAREDFERQNFNQAEDEIHTWLRSHPHDLEGQYLAARAHRLLSLEMLDKLLAAYPDSYRSHQLLAQTFEQRDEDDKAISEYKKVEELSPTLPGIHYALGHLLLKDGNLEEATLQLKEELRLNPVQPEANAEMGMAMLDQGEAPMAIPYLTRALSLQPDLWTAHEQLGKAYYLQKNYAGACKELTLAVTDDPEGVAHYQLGLVYKALGRGDDSRREFDSSRRIKSDRLAQVKIEMPRGANDD